MDVVGGKNSDVLGIAAIPENHSEQYPSSYLGKRGGGVHRPSLLIPSQAGSIGVSISNSRYLSSRLKLFIGGLGELGKSGSWAKSTHWNRTQFETKLDLRQLLRYLTTVLK